MLSWLQRVWTERVSYEGGLSLLYIDGLLLVPFVMAAFFYPVQALAAAAALLLVTFVSYEGWVFWKRHHLTHPRV